MTFGEHATLRLGTERGPGGEPGDRSEQDAEARMRQALSQFGQKSFRGESQGTPERRPAGGGGGSHGMGHGPASGRRHRFVQDGEVQVSVVRPRRDPVAAVPTRPDGRASEEQAAERSAREQAERKLAEAQMTIKALQTRVGHAELERDEALEQVRALREQIVAERAAWEEERAQRAAFLASSRRTRTEPPRTEVGRPDISAEDREPEPESESEPEPVKWWL